MMKGLRSLLLSCILPLSLKESFRQVNNIASFISDLGTKKIYLAHIYENSRGRDDGTEKYKRMIQDLREKGFDVSTHSRSGKPVQGIRDLSRDLSPDYAVLPWHNVDPLRRALVGSKDVDIVRSIQIPALIFKTKSNKQESGLGNVIYATSFRESDKHAISFLKEKKMSGDKLFFLHVGKRAPDPEADRDRRDSIEKGLQRLVSECNADFKKIETLQTVGSVRSQITREAKKRNADLVIMGKTDSIRGLDRIMGSTAESVVIRSSSNILLIPVPSSQIPGSGQNA